MKIALYALTSQAYKHTLKIQEQYPEVDIFAKSEIVSDRAHAMQGSLRETVENQFNVYDCHVFIMATGIVVRLIAPLLMHKSKDPAVLVGDENGDYLISLLSGHLGHANTYCSEISESVGSQAVITTASDVQGTLAVDTLAMKVNGVLNDFERAKTVTALIVEKKSIGIISDFPVNVVLPDAFEIIEKAEGKDGYIYISNRSLEKMKEPFAYIRMPNLVLGMGCRRGKTFEELDHFVSDTLESLNFSKDCVKSIGTVDVKADEKGLIELAEALEVPLQIWDRQAIQEIQDQFEGSEFVMQQIGVRAVAGPAGFLSSNRGKKRLGKIKRNGMTLSIWEERHG